MNKYITTNKTFKVEESKVKRDPTPFVYTKYDLVVDGNSGGS